MANTLDRLDYSHIQQLVKLADQVGLSDEKTEQLLVALSASGDRELAQDLEQILLLRGNKRIAHPFINDEKREGEFFLGHSIPSGSPVTLSKSQLNRHLLIVGETGSGKTNLMFSLISQLMRKNIPVWVFDYKQDFRHLLKNHNNLLVIRATDLKFNPLHPPRGVAPLQWLQVFCEVFSDSSGLLSGSKDFLLAHIYSLYKLYGVFSANKNRKYPSLHELADLLSYRRYPLSTKEARYLETVINRVKAAVLGIGDILDCETGFPLEVLLHRNVVFELEGINSDLQNFLTQVLLSWIYYYRMAQGQRGKLRQVIFFDEARRVFDVNKEKQYAAGPRIINLITTRAREFGESFIIADQELQKLTDTIKANSYGIVGLPLGSGKDINELSEVMGLTPRQRERLYKLNIGEGVFKRSGLGPVRLNIPLVKVSKDVSTPEVKERIHEPLEALSDQVTERYQPEKFINYLQKLGAGHKLKQKINVEEKKLDQFTHDSLSEEGEHLFLDIAGKPFRQLSKRYRRLNLSSYRGNRARKELLGRGLIKEVEINLGAGGRPKFFELTEKGEKLFEKLKPAEVYVVPGGGSFIHRFWQHKIGEYYRQKGYQTFIEFELGNSQLDLFCASSEKRIGVEVALSAQGELENLRKDLALDLDKICYACRDARVISQVGKRAREALGEEKIRQVRFCLVTDFLDK